MIKPPITDIPLADLPGAVKDLGLKPYAAWQIASWLYRERIDSFEAMTNLSKDARARLAESYVIEAVVVGGVQEARDGTKKFLCRARDGAAVECVLIPSEKERVTVCLSTQAGCAMGCTFCRTARMGFKRDLTQGEILGQLIVAMRVSAEPVTNIVLMGMGEPLANMDAVASAVEAITCEGAFGMSKRRVTLSTSGLLPQLEAFSRRHDIKIAISLNATTDEVRDLLMPVNRRWPIARIMEFCREYSRRSRHRVTFEYVMIRGLNDTDEDAARLVKLLKGMRAKVNLIPFNPFEGSDLRAPKPATVERWHEYLSERGIQASIRQSRGQEIMAACGQLATAAGA